MAKVWGAAAHPWSLRAAKVRRDGRWEAGPAPHTEVCARTCRASLPVPQDPAEKFQNAKQAMENWVTANLRKESGAAIPPEEVAREYKKWFPSIGDKPSTIRQKAQARKIAEDNMRATSQGAWERHWRDAQKELENVEGKTRTSNRKESRTNKKTKPDWIVDRAGNLKRNR